MYEYKGRVTRVVDGDTVDAILDLGFGLTKKLRLRIDDFDAPETWRPRNDAELYHGTQATKRAEELLMDKDLIFLTSKLGIYGRYGCMIYLPSSVNGKIKFHEVMIAEGFEKKDSYDEPTKTKIIRT